jgi:hypothetical protein
MFVSFSARNRILAGHRSESKTIQNRRNCTVSAIVCDSIWMVHNQT